MSMPSCYGQVWEGIPGSLCVDQGCGVIDDCLMRFASGVLVDWQRQLGEQATVEQLSQATAVRPEAIQKALEFQKTAGIIPFVKPAVIGVDPAAPGTEKTVCTEAVGTEAQEFKQALAPEEVQQLYEKKEAPAEQPAVPFVESRLADVVQLPATAEAAGALQEVAEMPARKKGGKKKSAPKGKMPRGADKEKGAAAPVVDRPLLAGPVKRARVPAATRQGKRVLPAAAQEGSRRCQKPSRSRGPQLRRWSRSPAMNRSRWQRERQRSALIAQLRPGMKLKRIWEGRTLEVVCLKGGYRFQGELYPTLYSVVQAIVGTVPRRKQRRGDGTVPNGTREISNWSAPRFFRLPWIIGGKKGHT